MMDDRECCGWPEIGVCSDCPDPEVVAWGKAHPPKPAKTPIGHNVFLVAGSEPLSEEFLRVLDEAVDKRLPPRDTHAAAQAAEAAMLHRLHARQPSAADIDSAAECKAAGEHHWAADVSKTAWCVVCGERG